MSDAETIRFEPWSDPVYERHGFPIRSVYVEFCYAGVIGPTSLLLLRRVAVMLEGAGGKPITVDVAELAESRSAAPSTRAPRVPLARSCCPKPSTDRRPTGRTRRRARSGGSPAASGFRPVACTTFATSLRPG